MDRAFPFCGFKLFSRHCLWTHGTGDVMLIGPFLLLIRYLRTEVVFPLLFRWILSRIGSSHPIGALREPRS